MTKAKPILAVAALAGLMLISACGKKEDKPAAPTARAVRTAVVETRAIQGGLSASGVLVSREEAAVSAEVAGYRVARVLVEMGDVVRQGQVLVQLDDTLLRSQIDAQRALAAQAEVAAVQAAAQAKRVTGLDGSGVLSQEEIDQRRYGAESSRAAANAQAATLRDMQARAGKMAVRAPVSGVVLERTVRPGDQSGSGTPMFRIARDRLVELEAQVPESALPALRLGAPATVALPDGRRVQGTVRIIAPAVQADTKLAQVRIALPVTEGLRPGGFGQAVFGSLAADTLAVPEQALRYDADGVRLMTVAEGNKARAVVVKTGRRGGGYVELTSGPPAGTRVLLGAASFVLEGDVVNPMPATPAQTPAAAPAAKAPPAK